MTLTKADIVYGISNHLDLPKSKATKLVESVLEIIKTSLGDGEDILISGFGKFCVNEKKQRLSRNPATGEDLMLASRRVVTFKCSPRLRDKVEGKF